MNFRHILTATMTATTLAFASAAPAAPATPVEARLQQLEDRQAITQLVLDYGSSFDRRDWNLHRSLFTDEIEMDFSASIGSGLVRMKAADWVAGVKPFFESLQATQHVGMPLSIQLQGDRAYARTLLHAQHYQPNARGDAVQRMLGIYEIWFERGTQGWRIQKMVQHIDWNEGNWYVFLKAAGQAK
jgi:SnoaL-like domain